MILLDTSIWIDHFRSPDATVTDLLGAQEVAMHKAVLGEVLLGNFRDRATISGLLSEIPLVPGASDDDVLRVIELHALFGTGIGFIDAHLVTACLLARTTYLWTRDRRLQVVAARLGVDATTA